MSTPTSGNPVEQLTDIGPFSSAYVAVAEWPDQVPDVFVATNATAVRRAVVAYLARCWRDIDYALDGELRQWMDGEPPPEDLTDSDSVAQWLADLKEQVGAPWITVFGSPDTQPIVTGNNEPV